jgi:hypothetical protein
MSKRCRYTHKLNINIRITQTSFEHLCKVYECIGTVYVIRTFTPEKKPLILYCLLYRYINIYNEFSC